MAGRKFSGIEYDNRINSIIQETAKGVTGFTELVKWTAKNFDVSEQQARKDIKTARDRINEMMHDDLKSEIADAVMRYKTMMGKAIINMEFAEEQKDKKAWASEYRTLQNDLSKLLGLDAAQKVDITTQGESINGMSDDQIKERLKELKELKEQLD